MRTTAWTTAAAMALASGAFLSGRAAQAAAGNSPFAGNYTGQTGGQYPVTWGTISISAGGRISGTDVQGRAGSSRAPSRPTGPTRSAGPRGSG
jgi:hypothetical protein